MNGEFLDLGSEKIYAEVQKINRELMNMADNVSKVNSKGLTLTPSGSNDAIKKLNADLAAQDKLIQQLQSKLVQYAQRQEANAAKVVAAKEKERLAEIKLAQDREKAFDRAAAKEAKAAQEAIKASNKIIAQKEKEFAKFEKAFNKYEADLAKKAIAEEKANQKAILSAEKQRLAEIKLDQAREKAFDKYEAKLKKEEAALSRAENLYNKIQKAVNETTQKYNNLAAKKALGNELSASELRLLSIYEAQLKKYNGVLLQIDANIGKHQRNVGNYASGFNGLSNSINQITREAPAFANSLQTGFLAISNNLPILFDEIKRTSDGIKAMRAEGQQVPGLFSQLTTSIFSWGTALSLGVTLLTLFGENIADSLFGLKAKDEALKKQKETQEAAARVEQEYAEKIKQTAAEEQTRAKTLFETAANEQLTSDRRKKALDELRERYGKYLKDLSDQEIYAGNTAKAEEKLNEVLLKRGIALAVQDKIKIKYGELSDELVRQQKLQNELNAANEKLNNTNGKSLKTYDDLKNAQADALKNSQAYNRVVSLASANSIKDSKTKQDNIKAEIQQLFELYNANAVYLDAVNETGEAQKKSADEKRTYDVESINAIKAQISNLEELRDSVSRGSAAYEAYGFQVKLLSEVLNQLTGDVEELKDESEDGIKINLELDSEEFLTEAPFEDFKKNAAEFADRFQRDITDRFKNTFAIINGEIEGFGQNAYTTALAVSESFQEMFNFINEFSQESSEERLGRLAQERDVAIAFAGESAGAREEIERQYDARRRQIQRQQAEAEKRTAIFNSVINTAQAIVATLAKTPPPAGIPLAAIVGAIGAAQIAVIAAQPIPQFKDGGKHKGGLMMVNDGAGSNYREIIKTPDGKISMPEGRNVIMDAPAGTEIFNASKSRQMLDNILMANGISYAKQSSGGISDAGVDRIVSALHNMPQGDSITWSIDSRGEVIYRNSQNRSTQLMNNKKTFTAKRIGR